MNREDIQTLILRYDQTIQRIEERLEGIDLRTGPIPPMEIDLQAELVRSQLEFLLLNIQENKFQKEEQLLYLDKEEEWKKKQPVPLTFSVPSSVMLPDYTGVPPHAWPFQPAVPGVIEVKDVERTVFFRNNTNPNMGNVVVEMKAGILLDPMTRTLWTPTEEWTEEKSLPGMAL